MLKEIEILSKEMTTKDGGRKFRAFRGVQKDGRLITVKFRKEVTDIPTEDDFIAVVDSANMNVSHSKRWPELWIAKVESYKAVEDKSAGIRDRELEELF